MRPLTQVEAQNCPQVQHGGNHVPSTSDDLPDSISLAQIGIGVELIPRLPSPCTLLHYALIQVVHESVRPKDAPVPKLMTSAASMQMAGPLYYSAAPVEVHIRNFGKAAAELIWVACLRMPVAELEECLVDLGVAFGGAAGEAGTIVLIRLLFLLFFPRSAKLLR